MIVEVIKLIAPGLAPKVIDIMFSQNEDRFLKAMQLPGLSKSAKKKLEEKFLEREDLKIRALKGYPYLTAFIVVFVSVVVLLVVYQDKIKGWL